MIVYTIHYFVPVSIIIWPCNLSADVIATFASNWVLRFKSKN